LQGILEKKAMPDAPSILFIANPKAGIKSKQNLTDLIHQTLGISWSS